MKGERRTAVDLPALRTLWFNTGTRCNPACANCYIESSPRNDVLAYLSANEAADLLDEKRCGARAVEEIGFTEAEPFMNPTSSQCCRSRWAVASVPSF